MSKSDLLKLQVQQRKTLKHLQGLPARTASAAVYSLLGAEPVEAIIDRNRISLFYNIARLQGSTEQKILKRQLIVSDHNSSSIASSMRRTLEKYNLPSAETILECPPEKETWKNTTRKAIDDYWAIQWKEEIQSKSSLKHLQLQDNPTKNPHNIWKVVKPRIHETQRAEIKARLLTDTYVLQTNTARFNQNTVDKTCRLCNVEEETLEHFVLYCRALQNVRTEHIERIQSLVSVRLEDPDIILQLILDCTHERLRNIIPLSPNQIRDIERCSQVLCYKLHSTRSLLLTS